MKKKYLLLFSIVFLFFAFNSLVFAEQAKEEVAIHFFDDRLCPVCRDAKNFIEDLKSDYPEIDLIIYPISDTKKLEEIAKEHRVEDYRVMAPTIFIGDNFFQFRDFTSRNEEMIVQAIQGEKVDGDCCLTRIPILNIEVDIGDWSLPLIAMVLGSIDGFNVCSIGALILILSIVLAFNSKKKIFFFGSLFIITTVVIYGSLVFIWGKLFEALIGQLEILRVIVGLAALGGGIYFFKEFWRFFRYGPTCESSESDIARKAIERVKNVFNKPNQGILILSGAIISFAAIITIIELPCSVGVPIAFSGILIEAGVSLFEYVVYILIFLFFYMLIEMIVFTGAVFTKKIWFAGSKAITWITFTGSVILFYLAFYYLFS